MTRPLLLDLFCCEGGAATGYHRAGFDIIGVDVVAQPRYPFEFVCADALCGLDYLTNRRPVAAIHASPPCQRYSDLAKRNGNGDDWPDMVADVRAALERTGLPYVIENVEGAPLVDPVRVCGTVFPKQLRVIRHRMFESNVGLEGTPCRPHPLVFTHDKRKAHYGKLDQDTSYVQVTGGGNCTVANKRDAMGMPWASGHGCNEAIPPAYTEFIGQQLLAYVTAGAAP